MRKMLTMSINSLQMEMQLKSVCLKVQKGVNCKNMETSFGFMREKFNDFCDSGHHALQKKRESEK